MNSSFQGKWAMRILAALGCTVLAAATLGYPPAPHHTLFGTVRNQWGEPLDLNGATVLLQSTNGPGVEVVVVSSTEPGVNYRMQVPMDSGTTADVYQPSALRRSQSFQIKVRIGRITYLPIEIAVLSPQIGQPAGSTRLDLTLGEDLDGDGLPDAWEQAIIAMLGGTLDSITPEGDSDGDGLINYDEYLAGTFPFDPSDGFELTLKGADSGNARLEFLAIRGRTYTVQASVDLQQWTPVSFRVITGGVPGAVQSDYLSTDVRNLELEVPPVAGSENYRFFKAVVQ